MANLFKNALYADVGTSQTTVFTSPASTTSTIVGLSLANITTSNITVDVEVTDNSSGTTVYLVKNAPVVVGGSLIVVGGDQKLILEQNDTIKVTSSDATSVDVFLSMLQSS